MASPSSSSKPKPLKRRNSRILLTVLIIFTFFLAYLSAIGIRMAGENKEFQRAMEDMQRNSDQNFQPVPPDTLPESESISDSL